MKKSRRDFLIKSGISLGAGVLASKLPPVEALLQLMSEQIIRKAQASESEDLINYISFNMPGSPARWCFDQMLKTKSQQTIMSNPSVITRLVGSASHYNEGSYELIDYKGTLVPWIWHSKVKNAQLGDRAMSDLLNHLIVFRGYGSGVDGHPSNFARQTNPVPSAGSLAGHVADRSPNLFRSLQFPPLGAFSGYSSIKGTGMSLVFPQGKINYAKSLMTPFTDRDETKGLLTLRNRYSQLINETQNQIRFIASGKTGDLQTLSMDFENSLKTLKDGISDLDSSWLALYAKYEKIILNTMRDRSIVGVSDLPIIVPENNLKWNIAVTDQMKPLTGTDLRDWHSTVDCTVMISCFALAEFVVTRGYCRSLELNGLEPTNLTGYFMGNTTPTVFNPIFDQHSYGAIPMTYLNSVFFRGLSAGILELIDQLKNKGEFDRTFIHLVQEFGRIPRLDGTGSDHGFDSMISSVITGAHEDKPIVLGNVSMIGPTPDGYPGTYGHKGLTRVNGSDMILNPAHMTSTLANIMKLSKNPWGNVAEPLIVRTGDRLDVKASGEIV